MNIFYADPDSTMGIVAEGQIKDAYGGEARLFFFTNYSDFIPQIPNQSFDAAIVEWAATGSRSLCAHITKLFPDVPIAIFSSYPREKILAELKSVGIDFPEDRVYFKSPLEKMPAFPRIIDALTRTRPKPGPKAAGQLAPTVA